VGDFLYVQRANLFLEMTEEEALEAHIEDYF